MDNKGERQKERGREGENSREIKKERKKEKEERKVDTIWTRKEKKHKWKEEN